MGNATPYTICSGRLLATLGAAALLCACLLAASSPSQAHAAATDAQMQTAFNRSIKAIKDYKNQPETISVDVSDLGLTNKQKQQVMDRVHYTGEYFWVNTMGVGKYTSTSLCYPCAYDDATITKMRSSFEAAIKKALYGIDSSTSKAQRVHLLHDWIIKKNTWVYDGKYEHKSAYGTIAGGKGDCLSFTLGMQVLLNRAGVTSLYVENMAVSSGSGHAWNLAKIGSNWYHVDTTWDRSWTGRFFWTDSICHRWLMQPDSVMKNDEHADGSGWTVYYKGAATKAYKGTSSAYAKDDGWKSSCAKKVKAGKTFTSNGITYLVGSNSTAYVKRISSSSKKRASTLKIWSKVAYRGYGYKVIGIKSGALKGTKARTVKIYATAFSKKRVKGSLKYSKITTVTVPKSKKRAYKTYFTKSNAGKKVRIK